MVKFKYWGKNSEWWPYMGLKIPKYFYFNWHIVCTHILKFLFNATGASVRLYCISNKHYCWILEIRIDKIYRK